MKKEKNFGFLLKKDEYETIGFRFFPKQSHVHGFGSTCPKAWEEVYKVYYSWSIVATDCGERSSFDVWDECSVLGDVAELITEFAAADAPDSKTLRAFGDGADWDIDYFVNRDCNIRRFHFGVWKHNRGFRFSLEREDALRFAAFIRKVQTYMLNHSEPI